MFSSLFLFFLGVAFTFIFLKSNKPLNIYSFILYLLFVFALAVVLRRAILNVPIIRYINPQGFISRLYTKNRALFIFLMLIKYLIRMAIFITVVLWVSKWQIPSFNPVLVALFIVFLFAFFAVSIYYECITYKTVNKA